MSDELPRAVARVKAAAEGLGIAVEIRQMPESTRTAEDAARACGCEVGQIVKSLVFRGRDSGKPLLLLVSGKNRVDEQAVATVIGEPIVRPDAGFVRDTTGYAIGGIPPFGHDRALDTYIDRDLLGYNSVWAAAGMPNSVMRLDPRAMADRLSARTLEVT
ncbi:MAG TPA: YbaK/EbsC family protein [Aestuariivirgaceae bacterium]|nr:YbaK/EbsC family protein [Aestuariivirgaceae bacterium]